MLKYFIKVNEVKGEVHESTFYFFEYFNKCCWVCLFYLWKKTAEFHFFY